jgi:hypothetical protein
VRVPTTPLTEGPSATELQRRGPDLAVVGMPRALRRIYVLPLALGVGMLLFVAWIAGDVQWYFLPLFGVPACLFTVLGCVGLWSKETEIVLDRHAGAITFRGPPPDGAPEKIPLADVVCIQIGAFDYDESDAPTVPLHEVNVVYTTPHVMRLNLVADEDLKKADHAAAVAADLIGCPVVSADQPRD